jgi:hypothetical protein
MSMIMQMEIKHVASFVWSTRMMSVHLLPFRQQMRNVERLLAPIERTFFQSCVLHACQRLNHLTQVSQMTVMQYSVYAH